MILVVGATGVLGGEVCRQVHEEGRAVRALVRSTAAPSALERLRSLAASIVPGDLKERSSLQAACRGVSAVISTATSTLSRQPGDSIHSVDREGQLSLVEAARAAGVKRFVYVSFAPIPVSFRLQDAKRTVERALMASGMDYTILRPVNFTEIWTSAHLGFDVQQGRVKIFGSGERPVGWVSLRDVARFARLCVELPSAKNRIFPMGGPDALSQLEVVQLSEQIAGRTLIREHVPEAVLADQVAAAPDPQHEAIAALMLSCARGYTVNDTSWMQADPTPPVSVWDHMMSLGAQGAGGSDEIRREV